MAGQVLRDKNNSRIGEIITKSNGVLELRDKNNSRLGEYDPKTNVTRDRNNSRVGTGNLLTTLLR